MRKVITTTVSIIVVVCLLPFAMGYLTKLSVERTLEKLSQSGQFKFEIKSYKMGWLGSDAVIVSHITDPAMASIYINSTKLINQAADIKDPQFEINAHIQHGPLLIFNKGDGKDVWRIGRGSLFCAFSLDEKVVAQLKPWIMKVPEFEMNALFSLSGNYETNYAFDGLTYTDKVKNLQVVWNGFQGTLHATSDLKKLKFVGQIFGLTATSPSANFAMGDIVVRSNTQKNKQFDVWDGSTSISLQSLKFNANKDKFSLNELTLTSNSETENALSNVSLMFMLDKVAVGDEHYGPAHTVLSLKNIDTATVVKFRDQAQAINKEKNLTRDELRDRYMKLVETAAMMFSKGAIIDLNTAQFQTPVGNLDLDANVVFPPFSATDIPVGIEEKLIKGTRITVNAEAPIVFVHNIMKSFILNNIKKHRYVTIDDSDEPSPQQLQAQVEKQTQAALAEVENGGGLVKSGTNYVVKLTFDQGKLLVNGKPMDLPFLPHN